MAKKYSDIVTLREQKAAYNIQNEEAGDWKDFIANEQFNNILQKVISSVYNNNADLHKSFWISGTYGTGKSHAGAVIKHLLCDTVEEISDYINDEYKEAKYDLLRSDLFKLRESKRLFPVTLYGQSSISHKDDLSLKLQLSITEALRKADLKNIDVKTDFDNYINHIETQPDFWDILIESCSQLKAVAPTRQKLIVELKNGDTKTLGIVQNALRNGKYHIRLDNNSLSQWFFEVQKKMAAETEYDGLLIIWDEFTEVMRSDIGLSLLVSLQEIDEMIMNPDNNSYFFYISHPSALDSLKDEEREKTKGRYHYTGYNMEPVSAFKIMSRKFKVVEESRKEYTVLTDSFYSDKQDLLYSYCSKISNKPEETKSDITKLFPLHPSTAHLATYYAREAGSSSRSVFQFIGENPAIRHFFDSEECFANLNTITADYLWDYVVVEFNENVVKFGAVTERFNSRKLQVEDKGSDYFAVFKSVLLLNALNNVTGEKDEKMVPSEKNIKDIFMGTSIEGNLEKILNYFDENGIIQRQPGGLFSIQFSALPTKEIEETKDILIKTQFKFTSQIVNFGETAKNEISKFLSNVARANQLLLYSEDSNEYTLLNKIENGYKQAKSYEVFMALLFARNASELNILKDIATRASAEERFKNIVFIVFENVFGEKNYERFIEYQANATCAQNHGFADQQKTHTKCASDMIKDWMNDVRRGNFTYYLRGLQDISATTKIATTINACVSPIIFSHGPESLELIQTRFSKTYWVKVSAKKVVDNILSFNAKTEINDRCGGQLTHVNFLLQDSVDENLEWEDSIDKNHPLYLVSEFIDKKFKYTDKNQSFNLGEKLIDLTKPPFGLYQSYAGMGMVAFAMRKYIKQIFDLNGKPREAQHLVEDIVELFKSWDDEKTSGKLNFRFETKESRNLCENFVKLFKLNALKGYNDISSLTDARWAITHEFSKERAYPLWALKYVVDKEGIKTLIDNILKICGETDIRNPQLLNDTLDGIETYRFEVVNLLNQSNSFEIGFANYLKSREHVYLKDHEVEEAKEYIIKHLQGEVGLWTENEVEYTLRSWRLEINQKQEPPPPLPPSSSPPPFPPIHDEKYKTKQHTALGKIQLITDVNRAKHLLEKICESGNETILDIINNYDV